jgi:hypothetical protein
MPDCYVCAEEEPEDDHPRDCECHECAADRLAMRGDYLRDEMLDRMMEEKREAKQTP